MLVDRMLFPVTTLGPGKRMVIWTVGCKKRCKKCANPELRGFDQSKDISLDTLKRMIQNIDAEQIDGFTISGGEPLCQAEELYDLMQYMHTITHDILLFTGYSMSEIEENKHNMVKKCVDMAAVLVAGEYIDSLNDNETALIASTNQTLVFCDEQYKREYIKYIGEGRKIQNIFYGSSMLSVGIHNNKKKG